MKKIITILSLVAFSFITYGQTNDQPAQKIIYEILGPDGNKSVEVHDSKQSTNIEINAKDTFYKYEVYEAKNLNLLYTKRNSDNKASIDKSIFKTGKYIVKLYDKSFVITFDLPITSTAA